MQYWEYVHRLVIRGVFSFFYCMSNDSNATTKLFNSDRKDDKKWLQDFLVCPKYSCPKGKYVFAACHSTPVLSACVMESWHFLFHNHVQLQELIVQELNSSLILAAVKTVASHCITVSKSNTHEVKCQPQLYSLHYHCKEISNSFNSSQAGNTLLICFLILQINQGWFPHSIQPSRTCSDYLR